MCGTTEVLCTKKYNISPVGSCLMSFIQLPIFFAFLEAINRIPAIFEEYLGAFQLGTTPLVALKSGNYYYIILILLTILTTYLSLSFNMKSAGSAEQQQQMKFMTGFMIVFISIASFIFFNYKSENIVIFLCFTVTFETYGFITSDAPAYNASPFSPSDLE